MAILISAGKDSRRPVVCGVALEPIDGIVVLYAGITMRRWNVREFVIRLSGYILRFLDFVCEERLQVAVLYFRGSGLTMSHTRRPCEINDYAASSSPTSVNTLVLPTEAMRTASCRTRQIEIMTHQSACNNQEGGGPRRFFFSPVSMRGTSLAFNNAGR